MVAPGENLGGLEFALALFGLLVYHFVFYFFTSQVLRGRLGRFELRVWLYGQGLGLFSLSHWALFGKTAVFPLAYSLALVLVWGYTLVDAAFRLISPRYRRHPEFFLEAMKEVTLPRGAEVTYVGLERFRERALCLPPKITGIWAFVLAPLLAFPWALFFVGNPGDALVLGVEGVLAGVLLAFLGFLIDLTAALLRYRWI